MYQRYCELRDSCGYKNAFVAKSLEITPSTFSDWKKGKSEPNVRKMVKIAKFLNTSVEYIVTGIQQEQFTLSDEEKRIISSYRRIDNTTKDNICLLLGVKRDIAMEESTVKTA